MLGGSAQSSVTMLMNCRHCVEDCAYWLNVATFCPSTGSRLIAVKSPHRSIPGLASYVAVPLRSRTSASDVLPGWIVDTHAERNSFLGSLARLYVTKSTPEESVATLGHPTSTSASAAPPRP